MSESYGFAGSNLYVDLSTGEIRKEPLNLELAHEYIGGVGIASRLLYDSVTQKTEPLSPENVLILANGPLIGTLAPGAARTVLLSRSPMSGLLAQATEGHSVGISLKYSGYDNLVITGRSRKPVYLKVFDDNVEIMDASLLWGKDTWQTVDLIHEELGPCSVSCIGPAGENLVKFANIRSNKRSGANKTGLGAVMGSKNLKAIVAHGTKGIKIASSGRFRRLVNRILASLKASPTTMSWRQYGSASGWPSDREGFRLDEYREKMWKRPYACLACQFFLCKSLSCPSLC